MGEIESRLAKLESRLDEVRQEMKRLNESQERLMFLILGAPDHNIEGMLNRQDKVEDSLDVLMADRQKLLWLLIGIGITATGVWRDVILSVIVKVIGGM